MNISEEILCTRMSGHYERLFELIFPLEKYDPEIAACPPRQDLIRKKCPLHGLLLPLGLTARRLQQRSPKAPVLRIYNSSVVVIELFVRDRVLCT